MRAKTGTTIIRNTNYVTARFGCLRRLTLHSRVDDHSAPQAEGLAFIFALVAFLCIVRTQIVFWTYTFPTNQITDNWTTVPDNWTTLRQQWEYSHATDALLNLLAMISLSASVVVHKGSNLSG